MEKPTKHGDVFNFPISVSLPKDVVVSFKTEPPEVCRLPPTISERHTKATTHYEIYVIIRRKGMIMKYDTRLDVTNLFQCSMTKCEVAP